MGVQSIDAEEDQFAYRYDTQLLIERRDEDLDAVSYTHLDLYKRQVWDAT